jgi:uncharacterized protein DUF4349
MKKALIALVILAAAAACGGASQTAGSANQGSTSYGGAISVPAGAPSKSVPQPVTGDTSNPPSTSSLPALQGPQVIRQAQLTITVTSGSFDTKLADVRNLVELEQGFIAGTDAQVNPTTNDPIRTGVITFMVPAAKFDATIDELTRLGKVHNEHISGQDVSAQYVDLQSRLVNEEAQRDAMLALLAKAQTVSDIIAVQNQLGQITGQIEQLKGQISYIEHNTAYSTITVDLTEAGAPVTTAPVDNWGFASSLSDAAHNFVTTINYLITGLGAIGPILILLGLGYLLWRRVGWPIVKRA